MRSGGGILSFGVGDSPLPANIFQRFYVVVKGMSGSHCLVCWASGLQSQSLNAGRQVLPAVDH